MGMSLVDRVVARILVRQRLARRDLDLSDWGLDGLTRGETVTLYHGSTRLFKTFDMSRSRTELVDNYYGSGIFLTPSKRVAESYAEANRNIGFDPEVIDDLKRRNRTAGDFMEQLYRRGRDAWDDLTPESLGVKPEEFSLALEKHFNGLDANTIADVAERILGTKLTYPVGDDPVHIFNMSTGMPDYVYNNLDELGLDSKVYRPKVYTVDVRVSNPLVTSSKSKARSAKSKGYDSVVYYGSDLVGGVPEVAVFSPQNAKVRHYEVV